MCMEESFAMLILSSEIEALLTITGWECTESLVMLILSSKIVHNQHKLYSIGYSEIINY